MIELLSDLTHFDVDLVANGVDIFHESSRFAIRTRRTDGALEGLLHPFAGNGNQPEIIKLQHLRWRTVTTQRLFQRLHYLLPVTALVHVDEINHNDSAEITQPNLANNFLDGVDVRLNNSVFQASGLADVFAGIHIYRNQRFRLIDDDVASALEPDLGLQRLINFFLQSELFE